MLDDRRHEAKINFGLAASRLRGFAASRLCSFEASRPRRQVVFLDKPNVLG